MKWPEAFCFVVPASDRSTQIPWVRHRNTTSVGNSTCFSMSLMVSSEALSFDFFSLFIALVRTFRKLSLALLVLCLASFTSISLCSLVTLKKSTHTQKLNKTIFSVRCWLPVKNLTPFCSLAQQSTALFCQLTIFTLLTDANIHA